jgi:hypothetical protein
MPVEVRQTVEVRQSGCGNAGAVASWQDCNLLTVIGIFAWSVTDEVSRFVKTNHPTREERASSRRSLFSRNEEDPHD